MTRDLKLMAGASPKACILTPPGRGAVATIRVVAGDSVIDAAQPAVFCANNGRAVCDQQIERIVFGRWGRSVSEDVVLCRLEPGLLEIHCHGGDSAVQRIMADLQRLGCQPESWRDQRVRRAGFLEAELQEALQQAPTLQTAAALAQQADGRLQREVDQLIVGLESTADSSKFTQQVSLRLDALIHHSRFGRHLIQPWRVVFAGRPNVGKSSLINVLLGYARSIVFDQPGTTRDAVGSDTAFEGWPVRLIDTAGLRPTGDDLERAGMLRTQQELATADCRVLVLDASQPALPEDVELLNTWPSSVIVAHKSDQPPAWGRDLPSGALRVSSLEKTGVCDLERVIVERLVPETPEREAVFPVTDRQAACLEQARQSAEDGAWDAARNALLQLRYGARAESHSSGASTLDS